MTAIRPASSLLPSGPVEVSALSARVPAAAGGGTQNGRAEITAPTARVAVLIVTWNRRELVASVLKAVANQRYPMSLMDVIVVDNASTDGTLEHLEALFRPECVVPNDAAQAHEPRFSAPRAAAPGPPPNTLGVASLTLIRNAQNFGGCGGFNTAFAYVEHAGGAAARFPRPDRLWLVDDDVDLPTDALPNLERTMDADPDIGLVGSRTCDLRDRTRTIETTIYFNSGTGFMQDEAPLGHPHRVEFAAWKSRVGGVRGRRGYTGLMNVDVVSACSMLARWDAVVGSAGGVGGKGGAPVRGREPVGFWDHRYFIYCDDADWCLRFGKRGWRVVLNLDAVVYHTPWILKLTPARIYYANRNRLWMAQKVLPRDQLRRATRKGVISILRESLYAALHRRIFHANIMLDTLDDAMGGRSGKTGSDGPTPVAVPAALEQAGAFGRGARIAVVCNSVESLELYGKLRGLAEAALRERPGAATPVWIPLVRHGLEDKPERPDPHQPVPTTSIVPVIPTGATRYSRAWAARLANQARLFFARPTVVVVFDQNCDLPFLYPRSPRITLHIDYRKPEVAQIERDGWEVRRRLLVRWANTAARSLRWASTLVPSQTTTRYG